METNINYRVNQAKTSVSREAVDLFPHLCYCCYRSKRGRNQKQLLTEMVSDFTQFSSHRSLALNTEISLSKNSAISSAQLRYYCVKYWFQLISVFLFSR